MKFFLLAAVVAAVAVLNVSADSRERGLGLGSDSSEDGGRCQCSYRTNYCANFVGTTPMILGCPNTNSFIQCSSTTSCLVVRCPAGQVWDSTKNACSACAPNMHLDVFQQKCICNAGTTFNRTSLTCVTCPIGSVTFNDRCYCPRSTVYNPISNTCSACPAGSIMNREGECVCPVGVQVWNAAAFACVACPGTWQSVPSRRSLKQVCTCGGVNQIFDDDRVTCYTCPTGTAAYGNRCACTNNIFGQVFNKLTSQCVCPPRQVLNAAGNGCQWALFAPAATLPRAP